MGSVFDRARINVFNHGLNHFRPWFHGLFWDSNLRLAGDVTSGKQYEAHESGADAGLLLTAMFVREAGCAGCK